jgi:hypothetical protein
VNGRQPTNSTDANSSTRSAIYPARRAIERAVTDPIARPVRFFALLLPIWCVEIRATLREAQPYEVLDSYLTRAVAQAHIGDIHELAAFFGIHRSLADRAVRFLETIGHLRRAGDSLSLTELGAQSVQDGCRYVIKEDHQKIYFDSFASGPMPASHYAGVTYLPEATLTGSDRTTFQPVVSLEPFGHDALANLLAQPDRRDFNVPDGLRDARPTSIRQEWLPAYLIQNAGNPPYLAFTMASEGRDRHIEALATAIADSLAAERRTDAIGVWRQWLDTEGFRDISPHMLNNGVLRAVLPGSAFGGNARFRLHQLGSFETRQRSFIQLWCDDERLRRRAGLERARQMVGSRAVRTPEGLRAQLDQLAAQLAIEPPTADELVRYARETQDEVTLAALDDLA